MSFVFWVPAYIYDAPELKYISEAKYFDICSINTASALYKPIAADDN